MMRARRQLAGLLMLFVFGLGVTAAVSASPALDAWRSEVAATRGLVDNDIPQANAEARRLQATVPSDATPADRARLLNLLARIEIYGAQTELAAEHIREAQDIARRNGDRVGQAEVDLNIALNAVNQGRIDDMVDAVKDSMGILQGMDRPELVAEAMLRTSMMYRRLGQFDESVTVAMEAMDVAKRTGNPRALAYAHQGMAIAYDQSSRAKEAREHFAQMRDAAQRAHSGILEADAILGMGVVDSAMGDRDGGIDRVRQAIAMYRRIGGPFYVSHAVFELSSIYRREGQYAKALPLLDEDVGIYQRHGNIIGLWWSLIARSSSLQALGRTGAAKADAERAYALAKQIGFPVYLAGSAQRMGSLTAESGDFKRAYEFSAEAADMTAKAEREKSSARILQLAEQYKNESKQRQIDELNRRNEQQVLQQRWLWTVFAASTFLLAITAFFLFRLRRSTRVVEAANAQLRQSEEEIRGLNAGLERRVQERTAELRQKTRYQRVLFDTLPVWAWLKDTKGNVLASNQPADSVLTAQGEAVGPWSPRAEASRRDEAEVMESRQRKIVERQEAFPGAQEPVWVETYYAPVLDEDGTVLGTVGVARNISERKAEEAAREAALADAERLAQLRSDFLAQMSHELRTPLNSILGYTQILERDKTLDERQRAGLNVIQNSGEHLLTLINDILDFAKFEAGRVELDLTDVPLDHFLRTIGEIVGVRAEMKNLPFLCDLAPDLPVEIHADEKRLRQVLLNLLSNAVKFTDQGRVALRVRFFPPSRLRFEVQDTGVGISEDQREAIFLPFEQVGAGRHQLGGTGLGLPISRQLVRLMGGDIHVESRVGEGSTFWFELDTPVVRVVPPAMPAAEMVVGYQGPRKKILVVDDVAENRRMLVDMLGPLGFEMVEAENGAEGVEKAQAHRPDLILMDAVMHGMDGVEATRRLRRLPEFEQVPIVAVSASVSDCDEQSCRDAGMNGFLVKPIGMDRLLAKIAALLRLGWTYALFLEEPAAATGLELPPEGELRTLHELALQGDMRGILQSAERLEALDGRFRPFAGQLRQLAGGYQSKALLSLMERYLKRKREQ